MKQRQVKLSTLVISIAFVCVLTFNLTAGYFLFYFNGRLDNISQAEKDFGKLTKVREIIKEYYIGTADQKAMVEGAIDGYVTGMGDRWSHYFTKEEFAKLNEDSNPEFEGIGVQASHDAETNSLKVLEIYPNSPAEKAKIMINDLIISVDGQSVANLGYQGAVNKIRGEVGTDVKLKVINALTKQVNDVTLTRAKVKKISVRYQMLSGNIGLVRISEFESYTFDEFKIAVDKLVSDGAVGLVFDVRNNPGGQLDALIKMLDYILPKGTLLTQSDKSGKKTVYSSDDKMIDLPMSVLINESSISAAEFFAAAVSEFNKGHLVGVNTNGKCYSQERISLPDGSGLLLSTQQYLTPKGNNLVEKQGLKPDFYVELPQEDSDRIYELDPVDDAQLQKAVQVIFLPVDND